MQKMHMHERKEPIMLQDLDFGYLDNQYRQKCPQPHDTVLCMRGGDILIHRAEDNTLSFPTWAQVQSQCSTWHPWGDSRTQFIFTLQETDFYLWMGEAGEVPGFAYEPAATLRQVISKNLCFAAMTGWHLFTWYRNNQFCGRCGQKTQHDHKERMMRCPHCGNTIYPRISPAAIIAVTDGDRLVLSKYAGRAYTRFALIAGFLEIGETAEEGVAREVMEEVGLKVKNIRYYKSQPWGIAGNLLLGYFCDLDGDDTIRIDENELSMAGWYDRHNLPAEDDGISLTREMIRIFGEGKEPK